MNTDKTRADAPTDLLPCPFCGGADLEIVNTHTPSFWVRCNECEAEASGEYFPMPNGEVRHDRFSYSSTPNDTGFEADFDSLYPEYKEAFRSAVDAWNRRAPVEQPATAPQSEQRPCFIPTRQHGHELWQGGAKLAVASSDAIAEEITQALNARAPAPADGRAAFEYDDVVSICDAHGICLPIDCVEMVVEIVALSGLLAARAAATNEPA